MKWLMDVLALKCFMASAQRMQTSPHPHLIWEGLNFQTSYRETCVSPPAGRSSACYLTTIITSSSPSRVSDALMWIETRQNKDMWLFDESHCRPTTLQPQRGVDLWARHFTSSNSITQSHISYFYDEIWSRTTEFPSACSSRTVRWGGWRSSFSRGTRPCRSCRGRRSIWPSSARSVCLWTSSSSSLWGHVGLQPKCTRSCFTCSVK